MFDSPEIQNLLEEIRSAEKGGLVQVGKLAAAIVRASGIKGIESGFEAYPILNKILAMDVTFLHPKTQIPFDRHDGRDLSDEWLVQPDVAIEIVERLYQRRGQISLPLRQNPDETAGEGPAMSYRKLTGRRNILDKAIDKAIENAGGDEDTNAVFLALRDLALNEEPPFTGLLEAPL